MILVNLLKKTDHNAKISEIEGKVPSIFGLATTAAFIAVENKIPDISNLVKKTDYDAKILDNESKYFSTTDSNKSASQTLDANIIQKGLVDKSVITGLIADAHLYKKVDTLATKAELKSDQAKLKTCDLNYLLGKNFFGDDGSQVFLFISQHLIR